MKKINKLQLKKSVVAKLANTDMNQIAGGNVGVTTMIAEISNPCSGIVSCYPTAHNCTPTYALCPGTVLHCI